MKILYIAPSVSVPGFTGGSTHVYELSRHLAKQGCTVYVLARRMQGQKSYEYIEGFHVYRVWRGVFKEISPRSKIFDKKDHSSIHNFSRKLLEDVYFSTAYLLYAGTLALHLSLRYDVDVILERGDSHNIGGLVSILTNKPLVTEVRDVYQPITSLLRAKRILTYHPSIIKSPLLRSKAVLMYGGVDAEKFKPINRDLAKAKLGLSKDFIIGYVGSFMSTHKFDLILKLALRLKNFNVKFLMVGPFRPEVVRAVERAGLSKNFMFTGPIPHDNLPICISAMDVGLALYDQVSVAGPPYKVYEYMACGVPPLSTETAYSRMIVVDGVNGFLLRDNSFDELLHKVSILLKNDELRRTMSLEAQKTAMKYSWNREALRILTLLKMVVANEV